MDNGWKVQIHFSQAEKERLLEFARMYRKPSGKRLTASGMVAKMVREWMAENKTLAERLAERYELDAEYKPLAYSPSSSSVSSGPNAS